MKQLAESLAIPLAPCAVLYTIGFPLLFTFPLFALGIGVGEADLPEDATRPASPAVCACRLPVPGSNVYVWRHPDPEDGSLGAGTQDEWITKSPVTTADQLSDPEGVDIAYPSGLERTRPNVDGSTLRTDRDPESGAGAGGSTLDLLGFENVRDGGVIGHRRHARC
ncbi:hypothetical protein [Haloplanus litoreus]|uniref:Uncharacterized protein n=1 Tax=Haloplanus litoreus TaxID=767515 RepID=A0ABD6A455_9EURY